MDFCLFLVDKKYRENWDTYILIRLYWHIWFKSISKTITHELLIIDAGNIIIIIWNDSSTK